MAEKPETELIRQIREYLRLRGAVTTRVNSGMTVIEGERGRRMIRGAEAAVAVLLVWRVAVRSGLSEHECGILIHVLSMSFGWFTVRLWSGLKRLRPMAYGSAA